MPSKICYIYKTKPHRKLIFLREEVKYKSDELKIKYGTKAGDMLLASLFSSTWKKFN